MQVLTIAGVRVDVLHPCHVSGTYDSGLSFNDNSIVIRLEMGASSVLLMGDLSEEGEQTLLETGDLPASTYLKLGHHGSKTSSGPSLLRRVSPVAAIASCGRWNPYGFPHSRVKENLKGTETALFRTDTDGAIRLVINRNSVEISSRKRQAHPHEQGVLLLPQPRP